MTSPMKSVPGLLAIAALVAACSAKPTAQPEPAAKPQIPSALRGCWEAHDPPDEEFPNGINETLAVAADHVVTESAGVGRRVGTIERVDETTPQMFDGLISAREDNQLVTLATALELHPEDGSQGTLLLREGDAGSYRFSRCSPATAARQRLSLVIAETSRQDDPKPAPCGPNGACGDFLYRAEFHDARVIAGADLPKRFDARLTLHTPYIGTYVLALIVERQGDGSLLVRRQAGFNGRTGVACFDEPDEWPVDWKPDVPGLHYSRGDLCVTDKGQIDPNAPKG
jgi:hypothetical protein